MQLSALFTKHRTTQNTLRAKSVLLALACILASSHSHAVEPGQLGFSTGVDYSSGKYGQSQSTDIVYIPLTVKYDEDKFSLKMTVPYIRITGPGSVSPDSRVVINGASTNAKQTEEGLGDVVLAANYSAFEWANQKLYLDVGGKIKLPTASEERGLGTGKTDYSFSADLYKVIGKSTVFGTLGYKILGDPSGINLRNVFYGSVGASYTLDPKNTVGTSIDSRERTTANSQAVREYSVFHAYKIDKHYKLQSYLVFGDTTASVDYGGGMMLNISW